jgi:hypothetical protein
MLFLHEHWVADVTRRSRLAFMPTPIQHLPNGIHILHAQPVITHFPHNGIDSNMAAPSVQDPKDNVGMFIEKPSFLVVEPFSAGRLILAVFDDFKQGFNFSHLDTESVCFRHDQPSPNNRN